MDQNIQRTRYLYKYFRFVCVFLIAFDVITTIYSSVNMMQSNIHERVKTSSNEIALCVDSTLKLGEAIAGDPYINDSSKTLLERAMKLDSYTTAYGLFMVGVVDKEGNIASSIRHKTGYVGYRPYFKEMLVTKKTVLSDMYLAGADKTTKIYTLWVPTFDMTQPETKEVTGAITMSIYFDTIQNIIKERGSSAAYNCSLIDSEGVISANSMDDRRGQKLDFWFDKVIWRSISDTSVLRNVEKHRPFSYWAIVDGTLEYVEYMPLSNIDWTLSMRTDILKAYGTVFLPLLLKILVYLSLFWVVSMRKKYEIIEHDNLFNLISVNTGEVFVVYDVKKERMEYVSYNITRILGVDREELLKNPHLMSVYFDDYADEVVARLEANPQKNMTFEKTIDGKTFSFKVYLVDQGDTKKIIVLIADCTEEKAKNQLLQDTAKKAERANQAKTAFLSAMSHDFRTPMNAIIGMTEIAHKCLHDVVRVDDCLAKIQIASNHLLALINEVLDVSKIESNKMVLSEENMVVEEALQAAIVISEATRLEKKQQLEVTISGIKHQYVCGDVASLQKIFINILFNAVKYTGNGGKIKVTATEKDSDLVGYGCYEFSVTDNGVGMTKEFLEKVFMPFERAESSTVNKVQGTGLGLSISKRLANLMHGDITVSSVVGQGSTFTVVVKLKLQQGEEKGRETDTVTLPETLETQFAGKRVLVAEDNELNYEIAKELISGLGAVVERAEDGLEAVEKVRASAEGYYDFIFMDIQMPGMDGHQATLEIRKLERSDVKTLPIVAMSANAFAEDIEKSLASQMNDHISKPVDMKVLYATMKKYLG